MMDIKSKILSSETLKSISRGIEKESLRVSPSGVLSPKSHPVGLGSALTHPQITTDFSESQLELITGTHKSIEKCLAELKRIHQIVYENIDDEYLWCSSMPCDLPDDKAIPLGAYGSSNVGMAKTIYREGLSHRYGRRMQMISGIHYNFSIPNDTWALLEKDQSPSYLRKVRNSAYFALIRNFQREAWILLYLFGASPAISSTFANKKAQSLKSFTSGDMFLPLSTSLRMGPMGYQSDVQSSISVSYNSLSSYTRSLQQALSEEYPPYASIGVKNNSGSYNQLSTTLLQIENEFYSTIRPKRRINPGERALHALHNRGVEYIEIRAIDLNPFSEVGIEANTIRFIDMFLLYCLVSESPPDSPKEILDIHHNQHVVAEYGREPNITLSQNDRMLPLKDWGLKILDSCRPIASALDSANETKDYSLTLDLAEETIVDPEKSTSASVLREITQKFGGSFTDFNLYHSSLHKKIIKNEPYPPYLAEQDKASSQSSLFEQRKLEANSNQKFEEYRKSYINQTRSLSHQRRANVKN